MPNTKILAGDCIQTLKQLPDASVNCCVTSPPYFGLRDYGTAQWEGGDANCQHIERIAEHKGERADRDQTANIFKYKGECKICGAKSVDSQIGLEETPEEFVAKLVAVFREVRRVLKDDGTCWVNMGDSYAAQRSGTSMPAETIAGGKSGVGNVDANRGHDGKAGHAHRNASKIGLKHKDLIGIPWMLAFALRADGWYLRQDIIWHKPNPMPEAVKDRCTKAHEYIFLLSKSKTYYYDIDSVRQPWKQNPADIKRALNKHQGYEGKHDKGYNGNVRGQPVGDPNKGANKRSVWTVNPFGGSGTTAQVAMENGRDAILCELNPDYIKIIEKRLGEIDPLFTQSV